MFDRIAGVYDPMNTAMTAGLHHRWRARAAELARVGPGSRVLDVATGTGDLAIELARRVSPGGRGDRQRFRRGHARPGARPRRPTAHGDSRAGRASSGPTRWSCPTAMTPSTRRPSASARATSPISRAACGDGARRAARRAGGRARDHHPHAGAAVALLPPVVRPRRARAGEPGGPDHAAAHGSRDSAARAPFAEAYTYLPNSVKRFPAPAALAAEMQRAGLEDISYCSPPAASSRSTPAPFRRERA